MAASQVVSNIRRTVLDLVEQLPIKKLKRYRDESRAHRLMVASEVAYKEMQHQKDRAMIDIRRYGFAR